MEKRLKAQRRGLRIEVSSGSTASFSRSGGNDYCSKSLTSESRVRAEKAQNDGTFSLLERTLLCECGEHVGARPAADGPGFVPTLHYPLPVQRRRANPLGKPGYYK